MWAFNHRKLALSMSSTNVGKNHYHLISFVLTLEQDMLIMITVLEIKKNPGCPYFKSRATKALINPWFPSGKTHTFKCTTQQNIHCCLLSALNYMLTLPLLFYSPKSASLALNWHFTLSLLKIVILICDVLHFLSFQTS